MQALSKEMYNIYLDYNSTTSIHEEVLDDMVPFFNTHYGNPSSTHYLGVKSDDAIKNARACIANFIKADAEEIYFTSGGTEANNLALMGYIEKFQHAYPIHIITSVIEHPSIKDVCEKLSKNKDPYNGVEVSYIGVDKNGLLDLQSLENNIKKNTKLISVMAVDNIIGTVQDLEKIGRIAKKHNIVFHSDAVLAYGKIPIDVKKLNIDLMSISSHKIHGPKGIGALYIKKEIKVNSVILGGDQESGLRAGTENVPGIVGFGKASSLAFKKLDEWIEHSSNIRKIFVSEIRKNIQNIFILSDEKYCISSTVSILFLDVNADTIMKMLNYYGIAVSTCSLCDSHNKIFRKNVKKNIIKYPILEELNLSSREMMGAIRFSFGIGITERDIINTVEVLKIIITNLRQIKELN
ncbi:MAG: cysteine desulfurase [Oligoflexia bacterium]|nr:cysteine desulfurase [Oligoflexia bacterium]